MNDFEKRNSSMIQRMADDEKLKAESIAWMHNATKHEYSYHFTWLGRPIIQFPQDIVATQELIWKVKPQIIIETGVAHGGSLILSASMLQLIGEDAFVVGIDVDIRKHNRDALEQHPLFKRIQLIEGSSIDPQILDQVKKLVGARSPVMVFLDSNHTCDHVFEELEAYAPLVTKGSYLVVFDTIIENFPLNSYPDRPWDRGNNPMTAVDKFLAKNQRFVVDREIEGKLLITVAPGGWLKCISD